MIYSNKDKKTTLITINGKFGYGFRHSVNKIISNSQIKAIFNIISFTKISFYEFFSLEVYNILNKLLTSSNYGVYVSTIKSTIEYLEKNTWISGIVDCKPKNILDHTHHSNIFKYTPLPKQLQVFEYFERAKTCLGLNGILIHGEAGTGKELHKDTKVLTDKGFLPIKDLKEGLNVYTLDGTLTTITGFYPQGKKKLYRIKFEDGRSVLAGLDHQWKIYTANNIMVVNTKYLLENIHNSSIYIDTVSPIEYNNNKLSVYEIEVLVNNIFNMDYENIYHYLNKLEYSTSITRKYFISSILKDIYNIDNINKGMFTINDYTYGVMLKRIFYSLGYVSYLTKVDIDKYHLHYKQSGILKIDSVEYETTDDAYCIAVDHPSHLYVIENYLVTHNTFMSLSIAEMTHSSKILVICPLNTLNRVWSNSLDGDDSLYKIPPAYWSSEKEKVNTEHVKYYLSHYEYLPKLHKMYPYLKTSNLTVILDESHNLNELSARRTRLFLSLLDDLNPNTVLLLSGTPIKALGKEMIPIVKALDPLLFNTYVFNRFKKFTQINSYSAKELLGNRLGLLKATVTKEEVSIDKPITETLLIKTPNSKEYILSNVKDILVNFIEERTKYIEDNLHNFENYYNTIIDQYKIKLIPNTREYKEFITYVDNVNKIRKAYKKNRLRTVIEEIKKANEFERMYLEPMLAGEALKQFREAKTVYKYPALKIQGEALGYLTRLRIECFKEMAASVEYDNIIESTIKKTVIFSNYIDVAKTATTTLIEKYKYKPATVYGEYTKDLKEQVKHFTDIKDINPMVATYKSLSTGVPLIVANVAIIIDLPFRSYILEQAISRIARLGQDSKTYMYVCKLDTDNEINLIDRNLDIIKWSIEQVRDITGTDVNFEIEETPSMESIYDIAILLKDNDILSKPIIYKW